MRQLSLGIPAACQDATKSYEEAVRALNTLQSNAAVIEKIREERHKVRHLQLPQTIEMTQRAGVSLSDLDKLSVIHVSGTKGKGSTCAFCESILRSHGFKTGFYSSPHLVEVRERIRINGQPLQRDAFSNYFWDCYKKLDNTKADYDNTMPSYFRFLTIMAYYVFLQEKVDVAIIEVGIGGRYDCTNIVRSPVVCGVSSLGIDHVAILGDTLDKIAWNKAGIFKANVPAVTVAQPENAGDTLLQCAKDTNAPLFIARPLEDHDWCGQKMELGIAGRMQNRNASLALQLCDIWLRDHAKTVEDRKCGYEKFTHADGSTDLGPAMTITKDMQKGLKTCRWAGRNQTVKHPGLTYYLDGAHTTRSIEQCLDWFLPESATEKSKQTGKVVRILIFNTTGDRQAEKLLSLLKSGEFDCAVFCPNIATMSTSNADQTNFTVTVNSQFDRCQMHKKLWLQVSADQPSFSDVASLSGDSKKPRLSDSATPDPSLNSTSVSDPSTPDASLSYTFDCIKSALQWASQGRDPNLSSVVTELAPVPEQFRDAQHVQILCTGSLHLIGGVIKLVDPNYAD
jgi:folylpolyglutamate synthase